MIAEIITLLKSNTFYGAGEFTEIAKGKNELTSNFRIFKRKIQRVWQSRK